MQAESLITLSPQVANAGLALDNQRFHTKVLESRSDLKS
jgi:hypothetical protein